MQRDDLPPSSTIDQIGIEEYLIKSQFISMRICSLETPHFSSCLHTLLDKDFYDCVKKSQVDIPSLLNPMTSEVSSETMQKLGACSLEIADRLMSTSKRYNENWERYTKDISEMYKRRAKNAQHFITNEDDRTSIPKKAKFLREEKCPLDEILPTTSNTVTRAYNVTKFHRCMTAELCAKELLKCMTNDDLDRCLSERDVIKCAQNIKYAL